MNKVLIFLTVIALGCYSQQAQEIELLSLKSSQGITITGMGDVSNGNVNYAGDINADGLYDVLLWIDYNLYLIYGTESGPAEIDLSDFNSTQGFKISGSSPNAFSGTGDVNGDNIDDLLVESSYQTRVCVIFGSKTGLQNFSLAQCGSSPATAQIIGCTPGYTECSLGTTGGAGDINGDGMQDMLIAAYQAGPSTRENAGVIYIIFGNKDGLSNTNITTLTSAQGFSILGPAAASYLGQSASKAGDVNGDGIDDLIISGAGFPIYVIYGSPEISNIDLSTFNSTQGFTITGSTKIQINALSNAGDVNGDGIDDLLIGVGNSSSAFVYVLYGSKNMPSNVVLSSISPAQGFSILTHHPASFGDYLSGIGDFNQDGLDDVLVSSYEEDNGNGAAYVIYGTKSQPSSITVDSLTSTQGLVLIGSAGDGVGYTVSGIGDFNGDNSPDIAIGNLDYATGYVVYSPYSGPGPNPGPNPKSAERMGYTALFAIVMAFILNML